MAVITNEMKQIAERAPVWAVSTISKEGIPNVVPIGLGKIISDNQVLFMALFMDKTLKNLQSNPNMAVSVWDVMGMGGYQFKGKAKIETSGPFFEQGLKMMEEKLPLMMSQMPPEAVKMFETIMPNVKPKGAVVLEVNEIYKLGPQIEE